MSLRSAIQRLCSQYFYGLILHKKKFSMIRTIAIDDEPLALKLVSGYIQQTIPAI
jgi:hypothetical protein